MNKPLVFNYKEYEKLKEKCEQLEKENEKLRHDKGSLQIRCRIAEMNAKELDQMILEEVKKLRETIEQNNYKTFCGIPIEEAAQAVMKYKEAKENSHSWFEQMEICEGCVHLWAGRCLDFTNGCRNGSMKKTSWETKGGAE